MERTSTRSGGVGVSSSNDLNVRELPAYRVPKKHRELPAGRGRVLPRLRRRTSAAHRPLVSGPRSANAPASVRNDVVTVRKKGGEGVAIRVGLGQGSTGQRNSRRTKPLPEKMGLKGNFWGSEESGKSTPSLQNRREGNRNLGTEALVRRMVPDTDSSFHAGREAEGSLLRMLKGTAR